MNENALGKTILVMAPHTDDGEFGCGGLIAKCIEHGSRIIYVAFSAAEQSVLHNLPKDILRTEVKAATAVLGIQSEDCIVLDFEVRRFPEKRQQILDCMIEFRDEFQPDTVFLPSTNDTHQDHHTVAQEGFRAFKGLTMLGYEVPWNNLNFTTQCFVDLEEKHIKTKVKALEQYQSQAHRRYANEGFVRSLATTRGVQVGCNYAETFEVVRWVIN